MNEVDGEEEETCYKEEIIYSRQSISNTECKENVEELQPEWKEARRNCGLLAILNILQNYAVTALQMSEMRDLLTFRTDLYTVFKERLVSASKSDVELILSGSLSQKLTAFHFIYPSKESGQFGRKADTDIDVLIVDKSNKVTEKYTPGNNFLMQPTKHIGYVRLYKGVPNRSKCISSKGFRKHWKSFVDDTELFTRYTGRGNRFPRRGDTLTGPAITKVENLQMRDFFDHDFVPAIQCVDWPSQARDWILRKRSSDWPTRQLLEECVSSTCHVVPVGCKDSMCSEKGKEWRLSFTETEVKLARSFTEKQRQSYIAAKMLIKTAVNQLRNKIPYLKQYRLVSSYDVKTTMFWLCETRTNWDDVLANVKDIINSLLGYFGMRFLPDYFIPEKNLIAGVSDDMFGICENILKETSYLPIQIFKACYYQTYSSCFQYDMDCSPLLRKMYNEICDFEKFGKPTRKLIIFTILQIMMEISSSIVCSYHARDLVSSILVMLDALNELHCQYVTVFGMTKLFSEDDISSLSSENETLEKLSSFNEVFVNTISNPDVISQLGNDVFAVLTVFFSDNVPSASIAYGGRAEIVEFAELVQLNINNEQLVRMAKDAYGSVENLLKKADEMEEEVSELYDIFSQTAETALIAYHNVVKENKLMETTDFACLEENVIVYCCETFEKNLSGILEEESLGCSSSRERLTLLRSKVKRSDIRMQIG
ncbi:uncharacterized protein LOC123533050 [Mercenaria mercenaria]|uniref:uncharacterized protein LOC123533050 n=1 Tax=Mercenaria mercenaria TaxID=6596 RepID=UPI00234EB268|nr:uncharacterized protein LOC123533050 [Mercenaria mercenaria]